VLTGGAALGAFEAGVIDALARSGLRPSLIVGSSIGALNAAYWAFNPRPDTGTALAAMWRSARERAIFPNRPLQLVSNLLHDDALGDPAPLRRVLRDVFGEDRAIEEAEVPLDIVATDLVAGEPVVMRTGPLVPALMASSAVPGFYPPVRIDGRLLVDGGVVANADLEAVVLHHIRDVILVELQAPAAAGELTGMRSVVEQALTIALARQTELARRAAGRQLRVAVVRLRPAHRPRAWDLSSADELFAMGKEAGDRLLDSHLRGGRVQPGVIDATQPATSPIGDGPHHRE
jgi:predicted acylesterase/phospholipase RssA